MKVSPDGAFPQVTQGPTAAQVADQVKASEGAAQQFAATLRAAGLATGLTTGPAAPHKTDHPRQIPQPSAPDRPRADLPRGSLIDIRV